MSDVVPAQVVSRPGMGFFKRRGVPEWALFFGDAEWREFERGRRAGRDHAARAAAATSRRNADRRQSPLRARQPGQVCHGEPVETWPSSSSATSRSRTRRRTRWRGRRRCRSCPERLLAAFDGERVVRSIADGPGPRTCCGRTSWTRRHPENGTPVAVPNRHTVLAHPIRDMSFVGVLGHMLDLARRMEQEGPGSISPHLYWLRDGRLEHLDARIDDAGVRLFPGAEFTAMLEALAR